MTNARRFRAIDLLVLGMLVLAATCLAQKPPVVDQIAKTYGLDSFSQIEAIRYTFSAQGAFNVSRSWIWEPKIG